MKKSKRIKSIIIGFLAAVMLCTAVFASSSLPPQVKKNIDVWYGFNVYVDGVKFEPKDYRYGTVIEPFNYDGWIYAPFEHIAAALGKTASYDNATRTLYLGKRPGALSQSLVAEVPPYDVSNNDYVKLESVTMGGTTYKDAVYYRLSNYSSTYTRYSLHNLSGQYKTLKGTIGRVDGTSKYDATFNFYGDGKLLETYELKSDDFPKQISVSVWGVTQLKIEVVLNNVGDTTYAFAGGTIE